MASTPLRAEPPLLVPTAVEVPLGEAALLAPRPPKLGRFQVESLLGEGGMGRVWAAWDPQLGRRVAVKVMLGDDPVAVRRFVREARAQAGLTHPHVCPVYEVGEEDGRPYLVMPLLEGRPLDEAAAEMPLELKLVTLMRVAEAVHEAHRAGLIHRDLKPGNVLVEAGPGGEPWPYVLDFGLARQATEAGVTEYGKALGTPAYMAPEQLRGEAAALDRRTDVYGLGATLFHLLAGRPPVVADSGAGALMQLLAGPAPPLKPYGVPAEVEAVVAKCLELEPQRRYGSARALAEDLGRYLDGEPVTARRVGWWYRLRRRMRRHAALVAVSAVSAALVLALTAWGLATSWRAAERERLARTFTAQVEEVEALARYSAMSPLHDVRPDRALLRERMAAIESARAAAGSLGRAAGDYALGRGFLALEQPEEARRHLEAAWQAGYREPRVAAARAQALSALFREKVAALELVGDMEARRRRLEQLEAEYGEPMRRSLGQTEPSDPAEETLLGALAAYHQGDFEGSLAALARAEGSWPWSFELQRLAGDVRRTRAVVLANENRVEEARAELGRAAEAYAKAAAIAESDPALHRALGQTAWARANQDVLRGEDVRLQLEVGLASLARAHEVDPDDPHAWLWQARLHRLAAQALRLRSEDPTAELRSALDSVARAEKLAGEPDEVLRERGQAEWSWAQWLRERAEDPRAHLEAAVAALDGVAPAGRDYGFFQTLALARMTLGDYLADHGEAAADAYQGALAAYRQAVGLHSAPFGALSNLGLCLLKRASLPGTPEATTLLREAVVVLERAHQLQPEHVAPHYYLGQARLRLAHLGGPANGQLDPAGTEAAIAHYQEARRVSPRMHAVASALGEAWQLRAVAAWDGGADPEPFFQRARAAYAEGLAIAPDDPLLLQNLAWAAYFQGKLRVREGLSPGSHLDEAIRLSRAALARSTQPGALLCLGSAFRLLAERDLTQGHDPERYLAAARESLHRLLGLNPRHAQAHRSMGRLATLEASWRLAAGGDPAPALTRARAALARSLELEPRASPFWLADARLARVEALALGGGAAAGALERGLTSADRALELRPGWPEARALRSALLGLQAGGRDLADRSRLEAEAAAELSAALAANPRLRGEWSDPRGTAPR